MALVKGAHSHSDLKNYLNAHEETDFQRRKAVLSPAGLPLIGTFMETFEQKCNQLLIGNQALHSGVVQRASSYLEPANILRFLGNVVPFGNAAALVEPLAMAADAMTEQQEKARRNQYFRQDPRALPREFQKLAYVLSLQYEAALQQLSVEGARDLGEYCAKRVKDYLCNDNAYSQSINKDQGLVIQEASAKVRGEMIE